MLRVSANAALRREVASGEAASYARLDFLIRGKSGETQEKGCHADSLRGAWHESIMSGGQPHQHVQRSHSGGQGCGHKRSPKRPGRSDQKDRPS